MKDEFEKYFGSGTREQRAARMDGEAVANPTKYSADEQALGDLLTDILGHRPVKPGQHARWLLHECGGNYDGLRRLITTKRLQGDLDWVQGKGKNVYSLRSVLAEEYQRERQAEKQRQFENSSAGRLARYAYPGILM